MINKHAIDFFFFIESETVPVQESSEAEVGGSSQESAGEGSPMVSSQGSLPASPQQVIFCLMKKFNSIDCNKMLIIL